MLHRAVICSAGGRKVKEPLAERTCFGGIYAGEKGGFLRLELCSNLDMNRWPWSAIADTSWWTLSFGEATVHFLLPFRTQTTTSCSRIRFLPRYVQRCLHTLQAGTTKMENIFVTVSPQNALRLRPLHRYYRYPRNSPGNPGRVASLPADVDVPRVHFRLT